MSAEGPIIKPGVAYIKSEFLVPASVNTVSLRAEDGPKRTVEAGASDEMPPHKKRKGQNKHRPRLAREPQHVKLCRFVLAASVDDCQQTHTDNSVGVPSIDDVGEALNKTIKKSKEDEKNADTTVVLTTGVTSLTMAHNQNASNGIVNLTTDAQAENFSNSCDSTLDKKSNISAPVNSTSVPVNNNSSLDNSASLPTASSSPLCPYPFCRYSHDVTAFLAAKPADIGSTCTNYATFGLCEYGLACRFGTEHIRNGCNIKNTAVWKRFENKTFVKNMLSKEDQTLLRKRLYNFDKAADAFKRADIDKRKPSGVATTKPMSGNGTATKTEQVIDGISESDTVPAIEAAVTIKPATDSSKDDCVSTAVITDTPASVSNDTGTSSSTNESSSGCSEDVCAPVDKEKSDCNGCKSAIQGRIGAASDEDLIRLRPEEKKKIIWRDQLYLAPLTTLGNLPYRRICRRLGADITCGEMAVATCLLQGHPSEWALVKRHHTETVFGVQVCGSNPSAMIKCSQLLSDMAEVDFVDINVGCPIDLIYKQGAGSALMRRTSALELMVRGMSALLPCPLTVKMRSAIRSAEPNAHVLAPLCREWGADMVTVHGRSREQRYTKNSDWQYIRQCAEAASPMSLFGNGDVLDYDDYVAKKQEAGVAGVMIGRGALMKPWIFTEIKEQRRWDISSSERFDILKEFVSNGLEHWGSDSEGVEKTRRFLLEWQSFLHRYIPLGLLERPPQTINQKPPPYIGRDHLETLMASPHSRDWIKISEMLLGPVPPFFEFVPKHKANTWD